MSATIEAHPYIACALFFVAGLYCGGLALSIFVVGKSGDKQ